MAFFKTTPPGALKRLYGELPGVTGFPDYAREMRLHGQNGGYSACRITLYSGGELFTINGDSDDPLNSDLITVHTEKDLEAPTGAFSITLHDRPIRNGAFKGKRLIQVVRQTDLITIAFKRSDSDGTRNRDYDTGFIDSGSDDYLGAMIGLVGQTPTISHSVDGDGASQRHVTITGYDMGKLLLNNQIYWYKDVPSANIEAFALKGWQYLKDGGFPAGTKAEIIKKALDNIFFKMMNFKIKTAGGEKDIDSLLGYRLGPTYGTIPVSTNFFNAEESMWAFCEGVAEKPWCEFYVDTVPNNPSFIQGTTPKSGINLEKPSDVLEGCRAMVILRETPFMQDTWSALPRFLIDDTVVHSVTLGGEPTLYNLFYGRPSAYIPAGSVAGSLLTGVPILNKASFEKHGLRQMIMESKVFPIFGKESEHGVIKKVGKELTERLYRWYAPSDEFLSGSIVVQGHAAYRVGTVLTHFHNVLDDPRDEGTLEAYIEGVTHDWQVFDGFKTTLRVTRGLYAGTVDRFPTPPGVDYEKSVQTSTILTTGDGVSRDGGPIA